MDADRTAAGHIFISHASSDYSVAESIAHALERRGVPVWLDRRELVSGDSLPDEIQNALDTSAHVVVLYSLESMKSTWVQWELQHAKEMRSQRDDGFRIIPVFLAPLEPSMAKSIFDDDPVSIGLREGPGAVDDALGALLDTLGLSKPSGPAPTQAPDARPFADLTLELIQPTIHDTGDGKPRAKALARLVYDPADPDKPKSDGEFFDFVAPLGPIEAGELTWYLERYSTWPSPVFQVRAREVEEDLPIWGRRLFGALPAAPCADILRSWRRDDQGAGRRLSVKVDIPKPLEPGEDANSEAAEGATLLLGLPWELLHDGTAHLFRGARGARIRRQLPRREPVDALVTEPPLRILLVSPRPEDKTATYIDHRASAKPLVEALAPLGARVQLELLHPPTVEALAKKIREAKEPYHVVHFDGHGVYDKHLGLGALCFEHPDDHAKLTKRRSVNVSAEKLADLMHQHRIPLVFLEACQTAVAEDDPTASVAGRLLDRGVASVVAMSHAVLVETARRFVGEFYGALMAGKRVGEAMLDGQLALAEDPRRGYGFGGEITLQDWFVPVLFQEEHDPQLVRELPGDDTRRVIAEGQRLAAGELPAAPEHGFVGRSRELLALERLLVLESYAVLLGEGGEGKTTLATELARWLLATRRFERAVFVSFEHVFDIRGFLVQLGEQLMPGFVAKMGPDVEEALQFLERALRDHPTILVLDNLETILPPPTDAGKPDALGTDTLGTDTFEPDLLNAVLAVCQRLNRASEATRLVFTSREPLLAPFDGQKHTVRIGRLRRREAIEVVGQVLHGEDFQPQGTDAGEDESEIEALVDAVNCHARSLVLVAREVTASGVRGATERLTEIMAALAARHPDDRERSLYASVELSLRRLPESTRERLPRLGVFQGGGHGWVIAQVLELDYDNDEEVELMQQLVAVGLGEIMPYGHLRLHPALGPMLWGRLTEDEQAEVRRVWVEAMVGLAGYLRSQQSQDIQLAATLTILETANLLTALEQLHTMNEAGLADAERVVGVATTMEGLFENLGRPRAMERVVRVRTEASEGLGEWSHGRFQAEDAAIDRLLEAGRFQEAVTAAESLVSRGLAAGEGAFPEATYDLAMAHFSLGRALHMGGAAGAALEPLVEAQKRFEALGGAGNRSAAGMTMKSWAELGDCLQALGRLEESAECYETSMGLAEELEDRRAAAVAKGQLGTVRLLQRRYGEALKAWTAFRTTFESLGETGTVATAWHQIGRVHEEAGHYESAERAYQQSLSLKAQLGDHSGEATTLNQLGINSRRAGRLEDAVRFYRQAADIFFEIDQPQKEGFARNNLAIVLIQLERFDEARREILRAIECIEPYGHTAQPWKAFIILHELERAIGNSPKAEAARTWAMELFLAYRRDGGENHNPGGRLALRVGEALASGKTAEVGRELAEWMKRPELPEWAQVLVPVLQQILDGSRDPALASDPRLDYDDAVEVRLLLEGLGSRE